MYLYCWVFDRCLVLSSSTLHCTVTNDQRLPEIRQYKYDISGDTV